MGNRSEIDEFGTIRYYDSKGNLHRKDGPAVEYTDGEVMYFIHGTLHREDGPAYASADGDALMYCLDGKAYDEVLFWRIVKVKVFW
jgi:hypothetical protein